MTQKYNGPIQLRRGTLAEWQDVNPALLYGEVAIAFDGPKPKVKIGNIDNDNFNDLPWMGGSAEIGAEVVGGLPNSIPYVNASGLLSNTNNLQYDGTFFNTPAIKTNYIYDYDGDGTIAFATQNGSHIHRFFLDGPYLRIKTVGQADAINIDGLNNRIGIFTPYPYATLHVNGGLFVQNTIVFGGNNDVISPTSSSGYMDLIPHSGVQTYSGSTKITKFYRGQSSFYTYTYTTNQGGIALRDVPGEASGWSYKTITGTNDAFWNGSRGIQFSEHTEEIIVRSPISFTQATAFSSAWLGSPQAYQSFDTVIVTGSSGYVDFVAMKYASSPYPTVRHSAKSMQFYTKSAAAWPDAPSLNGFYGTKVLDLQDNIVELGSRHNTAMLLQSSYAQINTNSIEAGFGWSTDHMFSIRIAYTSTYLFHVGIDGKVYAPMLPTSSSGLASGAIWNDSGTLKIV